MSLKCPYCNKPNLINFIPIDGVNFHQHVCECCNETFYFKTYFSVHIDVFKQINFGKSVHQWQLIKTIHQGATKEEYYCKRCGRREKTPAIDHCKKRQTFFKKIDLERE